MPWNGWPIMLPLKSCDTYRPPRISVFTDVPSVTVGSPGAAQVFTTAFHVPSMLLSFSCIGPGEAFFIISAIAASFAASVLGAASIVVVTLDG